MAKKHPLRTTTSTEESTLRPPPPALQDSDYTKEEKQETPVLQL